MAGHYLETGSVGWRHEGWDDSYYPDGLPEDWQLEFYTHLFRVLALPSDDWMTASTEEVEQWLEDGGDECSFFLMIDSPDWGTQQAEKLAHAGALLSGSLLGIVVMQDQVRLSDSMLSELSKHFKVFIDSDAPVSDDVFSVCWRPDRKTEHSVVGMLTANQSNNTRQLRGYIESFLQQAGEDRELYLLFSGEPPVIKAMQDAQVIGQMLTGN